MRVVFNTSPLIFLTKLHYIEKAFTLFNDVFIPETVIEEISKRDDDAKTTINKLIYSNDIKIKPTSLKNLNNALSEKLGRGEAEAIALAVELNLDLAILDDSSARKQALSMGLNVKGTLGIIRKLAEDKTITIEDSNDFYRKLYEIGFWVNENIFNDIFKENKKN